MNKLSNLNGWQRLWVLIGLIAFVSTMFFSYSTRPTRRAIYNEWSGRIIEFAVNNDPTLTEQKPWEIAQAYKDVPPELLVEKLTGQYLSKHPDFKTRVDEIGAPFNKQLKRFPITCAQHYIFGFLAWLIFMGALYLCGSAIGWVYRGFWPSNALR
jgi:hypothetical protein